MPQKKVINDCSIKYNNFFTEKPSNVFNDK